MSTGDDFFPEQTCPECGGDWPHAAEHNTEPERGRRRQIAMNPTHPVAPIRTVKPASLCPVCGSTPVDVVRTAHGLVQQADYLCASGHIWQTRWTVA